MPYYVYIILCSDGTFYTGYTKNVENRARLHASGRGARYTRMHPPQEIAYVEACETRSFAMRREKAIKRLNHQQKNSLVEEYKKRSSG
jgi:putative endonuclease